MILETEETKNGVRIMVRTEEKVAVLVEDGEKERILLPIGQRPDQDTYYYENPDGLAEISNGYVGFYPGRPDNIQVLN